MRVLFSSTRGMGHLQPLLPYAQALQSQGHQVMVAAPADVSETVKKAGLTHLPFPHPGDEGLEPIWAKMRALSPEDAIAAIVTEVFAGINARYALPALIEMLESWAPHLVIRDSVEFAAAVAADKLGIPHVRVAVHQRLMEEELLSHACAPVDELRRSVDLAADGGESLKNEAIFTSFPESFEGAALSAAGRAPYRVGPAPVIPPAAASFEAPVQGDAPLVYITFGTVASTTAGVVAVYQTALDAVAELPVRALLTTGRGFDRAALGTVPSNVQIEEWIPQSEVFPHAALLVCHGGSGTVLGGLAAGLPQVVVPLFADQPKNAARIAAIGAGLAVPNPDFSSLKAAISHVLSNQSFAEAARCVAEEMRLLPCMDDMVIDLLACGVVRGSKGETALS